MRVAISSDSILVEVESDDPYAPDVMDDLCRRAIGIVLEVVPALGSPDEDGD